MLLTACTVPMPYWTRIDAEGMLEVSPCTDSEFDALAIEYGSFDTDWVMQFEPAVQLEFDSQQVADGAVLYLDARLLGEAATELQPVSEWDRVRITYPDGEIIEIDDEDVDEGEWVRDPAEGPFQAECEKPSE